MPPPPPPPPSPFCGSRIITQAAWKQRLLAWTPPELDGRHWSLCFSSFTDDSSRAETFHRQCDQYNITLTVVRNSLNYTFGGYVRWPRFVSFRCCRFLLFVQIDRNYTQNSSAPAHTMRPCVRRLSVPAQLTPPDLPLAFLRLCVLCAVLFVHVSRRRAAGPRNGAVLSKGIAAAPTTRFATTAPPAATTSTG